LAQLCQKGHDNTIAAITSRLDDQDSGVRRAAVEALPSFCEKGDARAITAVTSRMEKRL